MSQDLKKLLGEVIEMHRAELCKMADLIYDFAETIVGNGNSDGFTIFNYSYWFR